MKVLFSVVSREESELSNSHLMQPLLELNVSTVTWGFGCALSNVLFLSGFIPVAYKSLAVRWEDWQVLNL